MNTMLPEQISELKLQSKQFRRTDPETYALVLREYAPVFDKYVFSGSSNAVFTLANLGNDAGMYGSCKLVLDSVKD